MAERIKSRAGLIAVTVVLIVISAFCIAGTVKGQSRDAFREEDGYYSRLEEDYLAQVRKILKEELCQFRADPDLQQGREGREDLSSENP